MLCVSVHLPPTTTRQGKYNNFSLLASASNLCVCVLSISCWLNLSCYMQPAAKLWLLQFALFAHSFVLHFAFGIEIQPAQQLIRPTFILVTQVLPSNRHKSKWAKEKKHYQTTTTTYSVSASDELKTVVEVARSSCCCCCFCFLSVTSVWHFCNFLQRALYLLFSTLFCSLCLSHSFFRSQ